MCAFIQTVRIFTIIMNNNNNIKKKKKQKEEELFKKRRNFIINGRVRVILFGITRLPYTLSVPSCDGGKKCQHHSALDCHNNK